MYTVLVLLTLLFSYLFSSSFWLALTVVELLFIVSAILLLRMDVQGLEVHAALKPVCRKGEETKLVLTVERRKLFLAAGTLQLHLEYENAKFQEKRIQLAELPLAWKKSEVELSYIPELCGMESICCKELVVLDMLRLLKVPLKKELRLYLTVYPQPVLLEVDRKEIASGNYEDGQSEKNRKGMDITQIYDLREYVPGDDIRKIHWKLSGKLDTLLTKEGSDTAHYDTMLFVDAALTDDKGMKNKKLLSEVIEMALTVSSQLLEGGVRHCMAFATEDALHCMQVGSRQEYAEMQEENLYAGLPKEQGTGLKFLVAENRYKEYTKLIYITDCPDRQRLSWLERYMDITEILLSENAKEIQVTDAGNSRRIEFPYKSLRSEKHSIQI